jgi:hypothetical protein
MGIHRYYALTYTIYSDGRPGARDLCIPASASRGLELSLRLCRFVGRRHASSQSDIALKVRCRQPEVLPGEVY